MVQPTTYWRSDVPLWGAGLLLAVVAGFIYLEGLVQMVEIWSNREEYSHGFLIPVIALYLIWQRGDRLREMPFTGSWLGAGLAVLGLFGFVLGELSTIYAVVQYAFVIFLIGCAWAVLGTAAFRLIAIPLCLLFFMVPFPNFIYNNISGKLQLVSSMIGVGVIRAFGIGVYLEGNVIDLGTYKLQVVEACNGLRYLFPLMTLGVIVAYFYNAALWKRLFIFFSTIPITILMNSFRIGVIGVMVEYWGQGMAEGFLHDFEGWVIFMACFGILFIEMWLLMRLSKDRRPLNQVFGIDPPQRAVAGVPFQARAMPVSGWVVVAAAVIAIAPALYITDREETPPERARFSAFPLAFDGWQGRPEVMEKVYLDILKLSDYALINYGREGGKGAVNFYVAWYDSQKKGQSAHSPATCLPGGGWEMESLSTIEVPGVAIGGVPLEVNRVQIALGESRQLVYYWFQQRGRVITNEYAVKWYMFWDALTRNRTDGALVRLIVPQRPGQDIEDLDRTLTEFAAAVAPLLPEYVPD